MLADDYDALHVFRRTRCRPAVGLPALISVHGFRPMVITDLLNQGVPMEDVQSLAGLSDISTTQLYDRRSGSVSRSIVERISV